jgi:hypothetical protein
MERNGQHARKVHEVVIRRKDREAVPNGNRADQEVSVGPLDASAATLVEESGSFFIVFRRHCHVGKRPQVLTETFKLRALLNPREQFLPNRPDYYRSAVFNERSKS